MLNNLNINNTIHYVGKCGAVMPKKKVIPANGETYEKKDDDNKVENVGDGDDNKVENGKKDEGAPFERPMVVKGSYIQHVVLAFINVTLGILCILL